MALSRLLRSLTGDRQPGLVPCRHPTGKYAHRLEAFSTQQLCRSDRAALFVSDRDDGSCTVSLQLIKLFAEFGQGAEDRLGKVASLPDKLVRVAHIEHKR